MALPTRGQPDWDDELGNHLAGIEADIQSAKANANAAISAANSALNVAQSVRGAVLGNADQATAAILDDEGSVSRAVLSATYASLDALGDEVAQAIAADSTVVTAAEVAVTGAMNNQYLSWTIPAAPASSFAAPTVATLRGTPAYGTPAKSGSALTSGVLQVTTTTAMRTALTSAAVTMECWARRASNPGATAAIVGDNQAYLAMNTDGTVRGRAFTQNITSTATIGDGNWHHLALCFDTNSGRSTMSNVTLWVDGVLAGTSAGPHGTNTIYDTFAIGGLVSAGADFGGQVDEVRLSKVRRYSGTFTPATTHTMDANTLVLMHLSSSAVDAGGTYPPRPVGAAAGAVTYVGPSTPTDWLTGDIWRQVT